MVYDGTCSMESRPYGCYSLCIPWWWSCYWCFDRIRSNNSILKRTFIGEDWCQSQGSFQKVSLCNNDLVSESNSDLKYTKFIAEWKLWKCLLWIIKHCLLQSRKSCPNWKIGQNQSRYQSDQVWRFIFRYSAFCSNRSWLRFGCDHVY